MIEELKYFWEQFDFAACPSISETVAIGQTEKGNSVLIGHNGQITEQYIQVQKLYRMVFSVIFLGKSRLYRLDERLAKEQFLPKLEKEMDYYQRYDMLMLRYFYLRNYVHVERLSAQESMIIINSLENRGNIGYFSDMVQLVNKTYLRVLEISPDTPNVYYELFSDIYGAGIVLGNTIIIAVCSRPKYDKNGMLDDYEAEQHRIQVIYNIKRQLESMLEEILKTNVCIVVEG